MAGKVKHLTIKMKTPTSASKLGKEIGRIVAKERKEVLRRNVIKAAHFVHETIINATDVNAYKQVLRDTDFRKWEEERSGYDIKMEGKSSFHFVLQISPRRYPANKYRGWNPVWGLLVSNFGRVGVSGVFTVNKYGRQVPGIPVPLEVGKRRYNHPIYHYGYKARYSKNKVGFVSELKAIAPTNWIDEAINSASKQVGNIIAGKSSYRPTRKNKIIG